MTLSLTTPVQYIPRVGPVMAKKLDILGIRTVEDLLWYVPFRYDDFSVVSEVAGVRVGDAVTITGTVDSFVNLRTKTGKHMQQAVISDATGTITAVWFNQPFLLNTIKKGAVISLAGKVGWFGAKRVLESPVYELGNEPTISLNMGRLVPIYPETKGVTSKWLRGRIHFVIKECIQYVFEYIPDAIRKTYSLMEIQKAIEYIHFPVDQKSAGEARRRLAFDELFLTQLYANEQKRLWQTTQRAYPMNLARRDLANLVQTLPFMLTDDQQHAIAEILDDLTKPIPMNRLLEGDVGSGKTVVAAIAMYAAWRNGYTSIFMAPTQILAEQHYQTLINLLSPVGINISLTTGSHVIPAPRKDSGQAPAGIHQDGSVLAKAGIGSGMTEEEGRNNNTSVFVGTHALLHQEIPNVGLVVIDEQQRFGVKQRMKLTGSKGTTPHLLTMTATPIPRTVARAMYGNLDLSVLNQMPAGRGKVKTWVVPKEKCKNAYAWISKKIQETGGQAFIVCPFIEESETMQTVKAVKTEYTRLQKIFPGLAIGLLHGRLKPQEKTTVLEHFRSRKYAILLSTPVVEVGIDIPNAFIMLIEGAERFGLSQLHQLRGRVGRGRIASFCLLCTESDEPNVTKRLKSLETTDSGPALAEIDLHLRGPGQLFGTRQHGLPMFKVANFSDTTLIAQAADAAKTITRASPDLSLFPKLRDKLKKGIIGVQD